ncbi:MAG: outer membrane lipoprotein-sorting protein [Treponema sp.]|jgi:outer membrane lipoprotein-sorting protein|nr:outer membrane lipoprotein-sorting protein [Treponema sp.]
MKKLLNSAILLAKSMSAFCADTRKGRIFAGFAFFTATALFAQSPSAMELLARVDDNEIYTTIQYEGDMIVENKGKRFVKTMKAWARGNADSFIEFINPEDIGTKYLKKGKQLSVYSPDLEEVMFISGHMLRESMMGSDLSYEDTIENERLSVRYVPVLAGENIFNGRQTWILDLVAKDKAKENYYKRKLWIDKENGDLVHYELFALSGAKLKEYTLIRAEVFGNKRFPVQSEMRDLLRKGSKTTFVIHNVILDQPISDSMFSQQNLEK